MGTCCKGSKKDDPHGIRANAKYDNKLSAQEREERRKKAAEAAENREKEHKMKGLSKKAYIESEMKKKRLEDAEKNKTPGDKALEWRVK